MESHQNDLRSDVYQGLYDAVHSSEFDPENSDVGKRIILPSTYPGSPRAMQQNYLDAMSMVKKFGKPDFFSL